MSVRKRGGVWYYDFMVKGERYRGRLPAVRLKEHAKDAEADIRLAVLKGEFGVSSGHVTLMSYIDDSFLPWSAENKRSHTDDLRHAETFRIYFGSKELREVTPMLIEKFKRDRRNQKTNRGSCLSNASINRELASLSKVFTMAVRDGLINANPCSKVKRFREDNKRYRYLTSDEEPKLIRQFVGARSHLRTIVLAAIHTGARRGELFNLRKEDVDFQRAQVWFKATKNRRDRAVPLNEVAVQVMKEQFALYPESEYVFPSPSTGGRYGTLKTAFLHACRDAKVRGLRFHDLRHTFGTRLADAGVDPFTISELMGHSDVRMTARYTHATERNKRGAVAALVSFGSDCHKFVTKEERKVG